MKISASFYSLYPTTHLNSRVNKAERRGVLLKFEFDLGKTGYADFHSPQTFEDCNLFESLRDLRGVQDTEHFKRAFNFAQIDSQAESHFDDSHKIKNHYL